MTTMTKTTKTTTDAAPWAGWHRPAARRPWRRVCEGESWSACWDILMAFTEAGDKVVLAAREDPNAPRQPAGRQPR
jgi:hypothetical protein